MGRQLNKLFAKKVMLWSAAVLLVVFGLLLRRTYKPEPVSVVKEAAKLERIEPAKLAKSVLHSSLAGRWYSADAATLSRLYPSACGVSIFRANSSFWA
jgi:hypothetical protein